MAAGGPVTTMNKFNYIVWLRGSLDNSKEGASGKKMSAFYVIMCLVTPLIASWAAWAWLHDNWTLLPQILDSLLIFAGAALTVNGVEKIMDKYKKPEDEKPNPAPDPGNTA
jgi:hypothetical protein